VIGDLSLFGIFVNGALVSAMVALGFHLLARCVFAFFGLYRFFWHPALVNVALFVIWWGVVAISIQASPTLLRFFLA
jgi:protein AaeX